MIKEFYYYLVILFSGLFDRAYYLLTYPDVRKADIDPLWHFVKYGWKEDRYPSRFFEERQNINAFSGQKNTIEDYINIYRIRKQENKSSFSLKDITKSNSLNGKNDKEIIKQRNEVFERKILFSILVPLYRTPLEFLEELLKSVIGQTYKYWELVLVDGSDKDYKVIKKKIQKWISKDTRIKYHRLNGNLGIAGNTNEAYKIAIGDYIVLLDHDDILTFDALFELATSINNDPELDIIYSDRAIFSNDTYKILAYHYLPGFSPDYLRSTNYMSHLITYSNKIIKRVGFEHEGYNGSQDYELLLRCSEKTNKILHIPKVLYYCRAAKGSVAQNPENKMYAYEAGREAISEHIERIGYPGKVEFLSDLFAYRIKYEIKQQKVSIIILNKDHIIDLKRCIKSILSLTTYSNYEILVVENNSNDQDTFHYYDSLASNSKIRIIEAKSTDFNYSALNNMAVDNANGDYVLLLNNDTEVINPEWVEEMIMFAQRDDVGAVGAKLLYPNNTIQHCGLIINLEGIIASHYGYKKPANENGYMNSLVLPQNYSAVTAACLMIKRQHYISVGGLDELYFPVGLNDVDFCLKLRDLELFNVWTPYAKLYHHEGNTRGKDYYGKNKIRYNDECAYFRKKWQKYFENGDPFDRENFKGW